MIKYIQGDATEPVGDGNKIIVHCVNNLRVMNAGIAKTIRNKWPEVYEQYKVRTPVLGDLQLIKVKRGLFVANLFGQDGVGYDKEGNPPVRYDALYNGFCKLEKIISENNVKSNTSVHLPRIAAGLAGGSWIIIESIIIDRLVNQGIEVIVYDLPIDTK